MGRLDWLRGSKLGEKIVAEVRASTYAERKALVEERESARASGDVDGEPLAREEHAADARVAEIEENLKTARDDALRARQARCAREAQAHAIVSRCDAQLERGADPRIDVFCEQLENEFQEQRHTSGAPGIDLHLAGLRQAKLDAIALKTAAVEDITAALAEIRSRIPNKFATAA
jgi:hypothetical protein